MSIASDRWIRARCVGEVHYELYYDDVLQGTSWPLATFKNDTVIDGHVVEALKLGEEATFHKGGSVIKVKCVETLLPGFKPLISPFVEESTKHLVFYRGTKVEHVKCPSFGLSSYGYDIRVDRKFIVFHDGVRAHTQRGRNHPFDPAYADHDKIPKVVQTIDLPGLEKQDYVTEVTADFIDIPPNGFILGVSTERICMPRDVTATCMAKSTLARMGLVAYVTPLEAGWDGYVTLEISNFSPNTIRLYAGIGIMQLIFHVGQEPCMVSYGDRAGKYQNQPAEPVPGAF